MKKYFIITLGFVVLVGFGCAKAPAAPEPIVVSDSAYQNPQYGFSFAYPISDDARVREDDVRKTTYVGLDVDFFLSVRDIVSEEDPLNIAYFYATKKISVDDFKKALEASDPAIKVTSTEEVTVNNIVLTKTVNTTAVGIDKTHYLFTAKDGETIIISVFLQQDEAFEPILKSLRTL